MNKRKLLSVILVICMMVSLVPSVAFAEDSGVDATPETEFYSGDGTVYVPATHVEKQTSWDLNTQLKDSRIYMTKGDKLTGTSEMVTTSSGTGKHTPSWCYYDQAACGHYGEDSYDHRQYLGFRLSGDASTLENLDAPVKVYSVDVVDETAMVTYGGSNTRPANTMTKKGYEAVETVTVLSYPTRILYKEYGETNVTHKRCGVKNAANENIPYDNYYYYVGGLLEVDSLSINAFPVKYNLQGGTMESGKTLPSKYFITVDSYVCDVNNPVRLGYTFAGWESNESKYVYAYKGNIKTWSLSQKWDKIETEAQTGSTLIAKWDASTVSISLDPNGGTIYGSSAVTKLNSISYNSEAGKDTSYLDVIPEKNGDEFLGWYLGGTKITCIDDIPQSVWNSNNSYTLTAKWNNEGQEPSEQKHSLKKTDAKAATCVAAGNKAYWTCSDCKKVYADAEGKAETTVEKMTIAATGHKWDKSTVTKEATATENGVKTYTCAVCGTTKTETISAIGVPEKGTEIKDEKGTASYEVTGSNTKNPTVTYTENKSSKATTVSIPPTVTVEGVTYKVTAIAEDAFKSNKKITKVTISKNIKTIGENAFNGCAKLKKVTVGSNVTSVGANAFKGCKALIRITLPSKTTKIGANAFNGCSKLKTITIKSKKMTSKTISKNAFKGVSSKATIKVPKGKAKSYKTLFRKKGLSKKAKVK